MQHSNVDLLDACYRFIFPAPFDATYHLMNGNGLLSSKHLSSSAIELYRCTNESIIVSFFLQLHFAAFCIPLCDLTGVTDSWC